MPRTKRSGSVVVLLWLMLSAAYPETISWFCDPNSINLTSDGSPMDGRFHFELGVFAGGFIPTPANTSQWTAHWVPAQRVAYNPNERLFAGQTSVSSNAAPFTLNAKAYVWGFAAGIASNQWILFRKNSWNWPEPNSLDPFGLTWYAPEADEVILGSINGSGRPYLMKAAAIDSDSPQTSWAQWQQEELYGEARNGINDDPDQDGLSNLLEYLFGTSPRVANTPPSTPVFPSELNGGTYLEMIIAYRGDHPVNLVVEVSSDLSTWSSGPLFTEVLESSSTKLRVRDLTPAGPQIPKRFMRLKASLP